jgi:hypothetical protein
MNNVLNVLITVMTALTLSVGISIPAALLRHYYLHLVAVRRVIALWLRNPQDMARLRPQIAQNVGSDVLDNAKKIEQGMVYRIVTWAATPTLFFLSILRYFRMKMP